MALLAILGSLLGGVLGRNSEKKAIAAQNAYNDPAAIRARAEAAGFNPLSFIGPGVGNQTALGGTNFMGSAIADSAAMLADQMAKKPVLAQLDNIKAQNAKLQGQVNGLTLRPKVGGVYSGKTPSVRSALGMPDVQASNFASSSGGRSGALRNPVGSRTSLYFGIDIPASQSVSDAGDFEQRWGELGGSLAGLGVMAADLASAAYNSPASRNLFSKLSGDQTPPPVNLRHSMPQVPSRVGRKIPNAPQLDIMGLDKYGNEWVDNSPLSLRPFVDRIKPLSKKSLPVDYWTFGAFKRSLPRFQLGR